MAFTSSDLTTFEAAIRELSSGAEEVQIGNRRWRKSNLKEMRETYDWMKQHVQLESGNTMYRGSFAKTSDQDDN